MASKLDILLKNAKNLICIKYTDGTIERCNIRRAHELVEAKKATYTSKSEWKKFIGKQPNDVTTEQIQEKKSKRKK